MTKIQLVFGSLVLATVITLAGIYAWTSVQKYEKETQINAQTAIEQTQIKEKAKVERTKERMNWIPWYKGGENKGE